MKGPSDRYGPVLYQIGIVVGLCLAFYLLYYLVFPALRDLGRFLLPIVAPFLIGWLIAALIEPVVSYLETRLRIGRGWSAFFTLVFIVGVSISLISIGISRLYGELVKLSNELPAYSQFWTTYIKEIFAELQSLYKAFDASPQLLDGLSRSLTTLVGGATSLTAQATNFVLAVLAFLPNMVLIMLIALMASFFISRDRQIISNISARVLPASVYETAAAVGEDVGKAIFGYIRAQLILVSITACQMIIGLYILGMDYAITTGLVIGLVDVLPYLGPGTILVPWIIYELLMRHFSLAAGLAILYGVVIVVRQLLEPKVVAENIGLHPLATLIAIYVGFKLFGVLGVILGPILLVVARAISRGSLFSKWMM